MATAVGIDGSVTFVTGHNAKFDRFDLTIGQRLINTTGYGETYEVNSGGLKFGRFTASGHVKFNVATSALGMDDLTGTGGSAVFQLASTCTETVTVIIETINVTSDVNGEERVTFSGPTSGAVVEAWDETA
jgi:hypothetical protein